MHKIINLYLWSLAYTMALHRKKSPALLNVRSSPIRGLNILLQGTKSWAYISLRSSQQENKSLERAIIGIPTEKQKPRWCEYTIFQRKTKFPHSANLQSPAFLGLHTEKILLQDANMKSSASSGTLLEKRNSARHGYMTIYFPSLTQQEKNPPS